LRQGLLSREIDQCRRGKRAGAEQKRSKTHGKAMRARRWQGEDKCDRLSNRDEFRRCMHIPARYCRLSRRASAALSWDAVATPQTSRCRAFGVAKLVRFEVVSASFARSQARFNGHPL
jgi:hypothetical protein